MPVHASGPGRSESPVSSPIGKKRHTAAHFPYTRFGHCRRQAGRVTSHKIIHACPLTANCQGSAGVHKNWCFTVGLPTSRWVALLPAAAAPA